MKIAILYRGQARQFNQSHRIFQHFTEVRHRHIEFEHHIYAWDSITPSNSGVPIAQQTINKGELLDVLKECYSPHSISIADERTHYNDVICPWTKLYKQKHNITDDNIWNSVRDHWVLNQIIADMRVQSQAYNYYKHKDKPDLIVDTRTEMMHWYADGVLEQYSNVLDNTVLANRSSVDPQGYRVVDDYTFIYNWNTLENMCKHTPEQRFKNSLYSDIQTHMDLKLKHDNWSSHYLYPVIVHTEQTYKLINRNIDFSETVLNVEDETQLNTVLNRTPHLDAYNEYSMLQNGEVIISENRISQEKTGLQQSLYSIHNSLKLTGRNPI